MSKRTHRPRPASQAPTDMPPMRVEYFDGRTEQVTATQRELGLFERERGDQPATIAEAAAGDHRDLQDRKSVV